MSRHGSARARATEALLFAAWAAVALYPLSLRGVDSVGYIGDSLESVYLVAWNVHQLFRQPLALFDANVLHPTPLALALTDHRLLPSIVVAPVVWLTGNPILACNVSIGLGCVLAAMGAARLARVLGLGGVPALAAGALYAFHTYQLNETPRLNVVWHGFLPFALAELALYLRTGEGRRAWTTAGFMLLQGWSSNYHLLYGAMLVAVIVVGALVARPALIARRLPLLALAAAVAAVLFAPIALPYLSSAAAHGYTRALPAGVDLGHFLSTSPWNAVYGPIGMPVRMQQQGPHFIGFVTLALAGAAVLGWAARRGGDTEDAALPARAWVPTAALLAVLFVLLSCGADVHAFGRSLGPGPYRLLYSFVPGFTLVRIPERLALIAMLFVALLAARGLWLLRRTRFAWAVIPLAFAMPVEHLSPAPALHQLPVGPERPAVYEWLARNGRGPIAEVPVRGEGLVRMETIEMYFSTAHWRPIIHGYTAYPPQLGRLLRRATLDFPMEASVQLLARAGVDTVVVHHGRGVVPIAEALSAAAASGRVALAAQFAGPAARLFDSAADEVYRIGSVRPRAAAPFPPGRRLRSASWRYRAGRADASRAGDDDVRTAWVVAESLNGDESIRVVFDVPVTVAGVVLPVTGATVLPSRFRVEGRDEHAGWSILATFDVAHALQLLEALMRDPSTASVGFTFPPRSVTAIRLAVERDGHSFDGWSLPEIEIYSP